MEEENLIVEDDADLREILKFYLENAGYKTLEAGSAETGLKLLSDKTLLVLLDVMLHGMSGYEMVKAIREKGCTIPVIFLTDGPQDWRCGRLSAIAASTVSNSPDTGTRWTNASSTR